MKRYLLFSLFSVLGLLSYSQTLSAGDLAIIGVGVDDEEVLVVALENISSGEEVFFTDEEWNGSSFNSGEGFYKWVTPSITAGDVFTLTTTGSSAGGSVSHQAGSFALGNSGDGVYLYQTSTNVYNTGTPTILGFAGEDAGDAGTLSGTGLTLGTNAIYFGGDNGIYVGTRTGQDKATYLSLIYGSSWTTSGSSQTFDMTDFTFASTPTITVSPSSLTGFSYVFGAGPSSEQSFTAEGSNLTTDITLTAPTNYEISTTSGSGFGSSITLTESGGTVSTTTIYVRLKAGLAVGAYNSENIACTSTGATTENVTCSGDVLAACTTPSAQATALVFSNVASTSMDVSFTAASPAADSYLVVRHTSSSLSSNPIDATTYAISDPLGGGVVVYNSTGTSFSDSGLSPTTTYYYFVFAYNNTACSGGPKYLSPALTDNETTTAAPAICGTESFDNLNAPGGSYGSGSFVGDSYTWTYNGARTVTSTYNITGTSIGFTSSGTRNVSTTSSVNGVGDVTYTVSSYFTGGGASDRTVELWVNGTQYDSYTLAAMSTDYTRTVSVNESGAVTIEFRSTGTRQIVLDDIEWTCNSALCTPPATQASAAAISTITNNSFDLSWTNGSGTDVIVVIKEGSAVGNEPVDGTSYLANATFGAGDSIDVGEYVIYNGTGTSVSVTGLSQNTTYHVAVYSYNSVDDCYLETSPAIANATTLCNPTPDNVSGFTTATCSNGEVSLNWTNPSTCFSNVLIFASETSCTSNTPTGNGAAYSPADTVYGNGDDDLDPGIAYLVYKGTGTSTTITGLTNGQAYCFKIFTRNGTTWSSGEEVSCTPNLNYCTAAATNTSFEFIEGVELNTINNTSANTTYSDFTSISTTLERGESYDLTVYVGDFYSTDSCLAWIDWDFDGVFEASEQVMDAYGSAPFVATINVPVGASLTTTTMRIRLYDSGAGTTNVTPCGTHTYGEVEDYAIEVIEPCTPTHTFTSMAPTTGPEGTSVTVTGTGFTASTTAFIGGVSANVNYINATSLELIIPSGASTNEIDIFESGCDIQTGSFTIIEESGTCVGGSNSFTDLFISEVYDSDANNVIHVELFNPTSSAINLSGYTLEFYFNGSGTSGRSVALSGSIASNSTYLAALGTSSNPCSGVSFDLTSGGSGINDNDDIRLYDGATEVDEWLGPASGSGYSHRRLSTATAPSTTYNAADWDILNTESCADLGLGPVSTFPFPTVDPISNDSACSLDFTANVTEGDLSTTGDVTYQWYYNDGVSATWTAVSSTAPANLTITGETTDNLTISSGASSVSTISGYQFYCEVIEDNTCQNASNTAKFEFSPEPYFRTIGSGSSQGDWDDVSLWEMSTDLTNWSAACDYPTSLNSDTIIIQSGDSIHIPNSIGAPDVSADQLIIQTGGTLVLGVDAELEIEEGSSGADFVIEGTYIDRSTSGAGNGTSFNNGATWFLASNATIIKTNTASASSYRDNFEGGISTIPADAHWIYCYNGDGNVAVATGASASAMYYPNLYFESTSGAHDFDNITEVFTGKGNNVNVKGDMFVGATGDPVTVINNNFNATPFTILGDLTIGAGSELTNQSYREFGGASNNGNYNVQYREGTFELKGDAIINGVFDASYFASGVSSAGALTAGSEGIVFSKSGSLQTVTGNGTSTLITYNASLDNADHLSITDINLEIDSQLIFTNGKIITVNSNDKVVLYNKLTTAIVGGVTAGADKYVEGKIEWTTDGASLYTFPVGHSSQNAQGFEINLTGTDGSTILAYLETNDSSPTETFAFCDLETHPGGGTVNAGNGNAGYDGILDQIEFNLASPLQWNVTNPSGGITTYDITVLANGGQDINPVTTANGVDVRYLMKNGEPGNTGYTTGQGLPSFTSTGFLACPNQYTLTGMTSFSKFTLDGANQANTTLPIELLSFDARKTNDDWVELIWATATEINNDFFTLERSKNGVDFEEIARIEGAGNSYETLSYSFIDENIRTPYIYYRLKQTDFDGTYTYSSIKVVTNNRLIAEPSIYPNPVQNQLTISNLNNESNIEWAIINILGQRVLSGKLSSEQNIDVSTLVEGQYVLQLNLNGNSIQYKLIKE